MDRFEGHIAGIGSDSGTRLVIGCWDTSPFGAFTDVMMEDAVGHRTLLAPSREVAEYVGATYAFDDVVLAGITSGLTPEHLVVEAGELHVIA